LEVLVNMRMQKVAGGIESDEVRMPNKKRKADLGINLRIRRGEYQLQQNLAFLRKSFNGSMILQNTFQFE